MLADATAIDFAYRALANPTLRAWQERAPHDPGWPYSVVAALETGRTWWTAVLDAIRLPPGVDLVAVTPRQIRNVVQRLIASSQWREGDPEVLVVLDAGYDTPRIAYLLGDLPVHVLDRMRSDRVLRRLAPPRRAGTNGRPPKHRGEFVFGDPATWGTEHVVTSTDTHRYRAATVQAWNSLHPRLTSRSAWADHDGPLPIIEGTVIRLRVEHLLSAGVNKPVWLWCSGVDATSADINRWWWMSVRRFGIEHTFRLFKQTLGWARPRLRDRKRPIGGPGCCWPFTPNSDWPESWSRICVVNGNAPPNRPG